MNRTNTISQNRSRGSQSHKAVADAATPEWNHNTALDGVAENRAQRRIMAAVDFSPASLKALDHAIVLAECLHSELVLVHVLNPIYTGALLNAVTRDKLREEARHREASKLRQLVGERAETLSIKYVVREGVPEYEILDAAASARVDLIVLGRQIRNGLSRALVGSVSEDVADLASCPVLVVNNEAAPACWQPAEH